MSQSEATSIYSCLATKVMAVQGGVGGGGWCHKPCMQGHRASLQCTRVAYLGLVSAVGAERNRRGFFTRGAARLVEEILMQ